MAFEHYIFEQAIETVGGYALERKVEVRDQVQPNTWVAGDWDQLHSLFVNLLSNGIRHAETGVLVKASGIEYGTEVLISVRMTGPMSLVYKPGISTKILELSFNDVLI